MINLEYKTDRYEALLKRFKGDGYAFKQFGDALSGKNLILRHDIDFCLNRALKIAQTNSKLGVKATFFIMASGFAYNIIDKDNQALIKEIVACGQTLSLHFDPTVYGDPQKGFKIERRLFEDLFDVSVDMVSIHRPGPFLDNNNMTLDDCSHTYMDKYFKDIKYCSDSGGSFKYGHPCDTEAYKKGQPIHLLLHPIWWTRDCNSATEFFLNWQKEEAHRIIDKTLENCKTFEKKAFWE